MLTTAMNFHEARGLDIPEGLSGKEDAAEIRWKYSQQSRRRCYLKVTERDEVSDRRWHHEGTAGQKTRTPSVLLCSEKRTLGRKMVAGQPERVSDDQGEVYEAQGADEADFT